MTQVAADVTKELIVQVANRIGTITLNRPEVRNSLTPAYLAHVIEAIRRLESDNEVRVIVLTGAGKAFSSGADMSFLNDLTGMTQEQIRTAVYSAFQGTTRAIKLCTKPTVAVVNGPAIGAGCELAVACDFRIVTEKSYFCENWIDLGIIPPLGGLYLLPQLIGLERAANMVMRATRVYGEEAVNIGLASQLTSEDELSDTVAKFTGELASRPAAALAVIKQALRRSADSSLANEWEFYVQAQSGLLKGADFSSAVESIQQGRAPKF